MTSLAIFVQWMWDKVVEGLGMRETEYNIFFFDLETTGAPGSGHCLASTNRIVSIAVRYGEEHKEWRCNPGIYVPKASTKFHGITNDQARSAVTDFGAAFDEFQEWVEERTTGVPVLVAHNAFGFDLPVMRRECDRLSRTLPSKWKYYDSLTAYRRFFPDRRSKALGDLYEAAFNHPLEGAHNASVDTLGLQRLFDKELRPLFLRTDIHADVPFVEDSSSLISIKGIGARTFRKVAPIVGGSKVRDLRRYVHRRFGLRNAAEIETFIRQEMGCYREELVFSVWMEIVQPAEKAHIVFERFPFAECGTLSAVRRGPLTLRFLDLAAEDGVRSTDQLSRFFMYSLEESREKLQAWLGSRGCPPKVSERLVASMCGSTA